MAVHEGIKLKCSECDYECNMKSDLGVFWAKIPLNPYNVKTQKTHFLKTLSWADSHLLESFYIFICTKIKKNYQSELFSLDACLSPMCPIPEKIDFYWNSVWNPFWRKRGSEICGGVG